jgi:hypothetical protein
MDENQETAKMPVEKIVAAKKLRELCDELQHRFTYHPPKDDQTQRYQLIRATARRMALEIAENTPPSREQSLAFTHLDMVVAFANAAIARRE